jgi:predicted aspartyl protease
LNGERDVSVSQRNSEEAFMIRLLMFLFFLGWGPFVSVAQPVTPLSAARLITKFSFRLLTGGIILLKAQVSEHPDTLNFILDTGSGGISLDSAAAQRLKMQPELSDRTIRGIAGIRRVYFVYNQSLHLPGLTVDSLNYHINDYEILTSSYGERIDGIIGYAFFSRYLVRIDYDSSKIFVYAKTRLKYPRGGFLLKPLLVNLPIVNVRVQDEEEIDYRYYFDTGAGMCLLLSTSFAKDSALLRKSRKWYDTQAEGLGGKAPMKQGVVRQLKIGPYKFKNVPTYLFEDEYNVTSYPYLGGLIGNDLLRRFNVFLNYEHREIYLLPNSHFYEPFDYSYTGLGMYLIDGEIRIVDVMPNSPGAQAGFEPGDIILAVENNFSNNIQAYKTLLQTPGARLKVLVLREGVPRLFTLRVKSTLKG